MTYIEIKYMTKQNKKWERANAIIISKVSYMIWGLV